MNTTDFSQYLTIFIAMIAVLIAHQQSQTNRLKLKFDLYEKRLAQYDALAELLGIIQRDGKVSLEDLFKFLQKTRDSYFLFGEEISDYLAEIYKKGVRLRRLDEQINNPTLPDEQRTRLAAEQEKFLNWFIDQVEVSRKKYSKHLSLRSLK